MDKSEHSESGDKCHAERSEQQRAKTKHGEATPSIEQRLDRLEEGLEEILKLLKDVIARGGTPSTMDNFDVSAASPLASTKLRRWYKMAHALEEYALRKSDVPTLKLAQQFINGVLQVCELRNAFQKGLHQVGGKQGVAANLGISRNAVYLRLKVIGLTSDHFCAHDISIETLIVQSPILSRVLELMHQKCVENDVLV